MNSSDARKFQKDLNSGLFGLVLLASLDAAGEDLYGYDLVKRLQGAQDGELMFTESAVYPVLRSMAKRGLLTSRIVPSYSGPPRRYYRITSEGQAMLAGWCNIWRETRDFVDQFVTH